MLFKNKIIKINITHCQIRPIFTFKFSIFVFFHKSKEDLLNYLILCFNNFSIEIKGHKNRNNYFPSIKMFILPGKLRKFCIKTKFPLSSYFFFKVWTVVLENWVFLLLQKLLILITMMQNLNGKIVITWTKLLDRSLSGLYFETSNSIILMRAYA
jgi:hypothetical protein